MNQRDDDPVFQAPQVADPGSVGMSDTRDFVRDTNAQSEPVQLGNYHIIREIGRGGMGAVFLAEDTKLERRVALKVMLPTYAENPKAKERFLREARAAAKVRHDNVVTVFQVDEANGLPFIALEYLHGMSLDRYWKNSNEPNLSFALRVVREMAQGLKAAHDCGLIHRDIKPANIWLESPDNRVKLLDFGLARAVVEDINLTQSGTIVGTPAYMSPEQGRGERVDHRSDLFSLGVVLYQLLTGQLPFQGNTTVAILTAIAVDHPKPPREINSAIPDKLNQLAMKLLAKEAKDRPENAGEVIRAIGELEITVPLPVQKQRGRTLTIVLAIILPFSVFVGWILLDKFRTPNAKNDAVAKVQSLPTPRTPPSPGEERDFEIAEGVTMRFCWIPPGKASLGEIEIVDSPVTRGLPIHSFETRGFWLGKYEVTQGEYTKVTGRNPSHFSTEGRGAERIPVQDTSRFPVETVSWNDCQDFLKLCSLNGLRLPHEDEWEYAYRGGNGSDRLYYWGDDLPKHFANIVLSKGMTAEVGSFAKAVPHPWGLCDMTGNVWEWCDNHYGENLGDHRVMRGGAWNTDPEYCRAAYRKNYSPNERHFLYGFRVCFKEK